MDQSEIEAVKALLTSKPRPAGWVERRQRLDEMGSVWPVADDIKFEPVDVEGVPGEWSIAPGSDASRILLFFHGGGYCSGSILSHRRDRGGPGSPDSHPRGGVSPRAGAPVSCGLGGRSDGMALRAKAGRYGATHCSRRRQCGGRVDTVSHGSTSRGWGGTSRLCVVVVALNGPDDVGFHGRDQGQC
jgi:hypothetical protein